MSRVAVRRHLRRAPKRKRPSEPSIERADIPIHKGSFGTVGEQDEFFVRFPGYSGGAGMYQDRDLDAGGIHIAGDAIREKAVDNLDDILGFGVVPTVVLRNYQGEAVSVQEVVKNAGSFYDVEEEVEQDVLVGVGDEDDFVDIQDIEPEDAGWRRAKRAILQSVDKESLIKIAILDIVTGNTDRHGENLLVTNGGYAYAIDHELTFHGQYIGPGDSKAWKWTQGEKTPVKVLKQMRDVDEGDFRAALAGIEDVEVDRAWGVFEALRRLDHVPRSDEF